MPEGPSIVLLKEAVLPFTGKKIIAVGGNTKTIDPSRLLNKKVVAFKSWGKHLLMFGSYSINEKKDREPRLSLCFDTGEIYFYTCSVKILEGEIDELYDWSADVMNESWDEKAAIKKMKADPEMLVCDALLNQDIFAGVGNIIKNEVLYRVQVHPESEVGALPAAKLKELTREARIYSFQFLEWKRIFELKKRYLAYTKKTCLRCNLPFIRKQLGKYKRRTFFCTNCQKLYA
jgi:endonuclease-8